MANIEAQMKAVGLREFWQTRTPAQKIKISLLGAVLFGPPIYFSEVREFYRDIQDPKEAIERAQVGPNRPMAIVRLEDNRQYVVAIGSDGTAEAKYQKYPFSMPRP